MNKQFQLLLALALFSSLACDESGFNLIVNPEILQGLTTFDYNTYFNIRQLVIEKTLVGKYIYDYKLEISNFTCRFIKPPTNVSTSYIKNSEGDNILVVDIKGFEGLFHTNFNLSYGIIKEMFKYTGISVHLDSLSFSISFNKKGELSVSPINVEFGKVDLTYVVEHKDILLRLTKYLIDNEINSAFNTTRKEIENIVKEIVNHPIFTFKSESVNLTFIDRPRFINVDLNETIQFMNMFLGKAFPILNDTKVIQFKTRGRFFMKDQSAAKYPFPEPVNMSVIKEKKNSNFQFLLSDYTLNTEIYSLFHSGRLDFTIPLFDLVPFESNVKGYSTIIPEFAKKYPHNNYNILSVVDIKEKKNNLPVLTTFLNRFEVNLNFNVAFLTYVGTQDILDLNLNVTATLHGNFISNDTSIYLSLNSIEVQGIYIITDNLNVDKKEIKKAIQYLLNKTLVDGYREILKRYNLSELLNEYLKNLGINLKNINIISKTGYNGITFDFNKYEPKY